MQTWHIIALVVVGLALLWWFFRKRTIPNASPVSLVPNVAAPGVNPATGQTIPPPPPPPPPNVDAPKSATSSAVAGLFPRLAPSAVLSHIPVVGTPIVRSITVPAAYANTAASKVNNAIGHIPVVGGALSAPGKAISKLTSWL